eukprot:20204-Heterococcus_DN1.PRE.3
MLKTTGAELHHQLQLVLMCGHLLLRNATIGHSAKMLRSIKAQQASSRTAVSVHNILLWAHTTALRLLLCIMYALVQVDVLSGLQQPDTALLQKAALSMPRTDMAVA